MARKASDRSGGEGSASSTPGQATHRDEAHEAADTNSSTNTSGVHGQIRGRDEGASGLDVGAALESDNAVQDAVDAVLYSALRMDRTSDTDADIAGLEHALHPGLMASLSPGTDIMGISAEDFLDMCHVLDEPLVDESWRELEYKAGVPTDPEDPSKRVKPPPPSRPPPPRNSMEQNLSQAVAGTDSQDQVDGSAYFQVFYNAADLSPTVGARRRGVQ